MLTQSRYVPITRNGSVVVLSLIGSEVAGVIGTVIRYSAETVTVATRNTRNGWTVDRDRVLTHADYPHNPGELYDCEACQSACHCQVIGVTCVADECDNLAEPYMY